MSIGYTEAPWRMALRQLLGLLLSIMQRHMYHEHSNEKLDYTNFLYSLLDPAPHSKYKSEVLFIISSMLPPKLPNYAKITMSVCSLLVSSLFVLPEFHPKNNFILISSRLHLKSPSNSSWWCISTRPLVRVNWPVSSRASPRPPPRPISPRRRRMLLNNHNLIRARIRRCRASRHPTP